ncbi:MAG: porin [Thermodesulfobacteriota bacterium]|nr:porin [Thermodesulfobacteriota bacterium]
MKRLILALIAVTAVFVMAGSAYADDRLELYGHYYVRSYWMDGYRDSMWSPTYNEDDQADFIRQKFMIGLKANIADDVYANFRADFGEAIWGHDYNSGYTRGAVAIPGYGDGNDNQTQMNIERAYVHIDKENWSLTVGQQFLALGIMEVYDGNPTAAKLRLKFEPVDVSLIYAKHKEGDSFSNHGDEKDKDVYIIDFSHDAETFSGDLFGVMLTDHSSNDESPYGIGLNIRGALAGINFDTELAYLGGETEDHDIDYEGLQFYLGANKDVTDMINIGAEFLWADAADDDEEQLTNLGNWDDFAPDSSNTPVWTYVTNVNWAPFDPSGDSAGALGGFICADFSIMEGLKAGTKIGYLEPDDDDMTVLDSIMSYNACVEYRIATNTDISLSYFKSDPDYDDASNDDSTNVFVGQLILNF